MSPPPIDFFGSLTPWCPRYAYNIKREKRAGEIVYNIWAWKEAPHAIFEWSLECVLPEEIEMVPGEMKWDGFRFAFHLHAEMKCPGGPFMSKPYKFVSPSLFRLLDCFIIYPWKRPQKFSSSLHVVFWTHQHAYAFSPISRPAFFFFY